MKIVFKTTLSAVIILYSFSCKKEPMQSLQQINSTHAVNQSVNDSNCVKRWIGSYANETNGDDTINQRHYIHDGIAQLPPRNWANYHTGLKYHIPSCHTIYGDNVIFEASLKNPQGEAGSVYGYNVALQIQGLDNFFEVYFSFDKAGQSYDHIFMGDYHVFNLPELVHYFPTFETLSVHLNSDKVRIFLNGSLLKTLDYDKTNNLGEIKWIGVGFKGTGTADWVKVYNRKTGSLLMQEDFDGDGQSNVKWYD